MSKLNTHTDTFPLELLFQRLELAGFRISPGDRLRALRILGGPGKHYLRQPNQLKLLLAPVLTRSEAEQLKFYEVFDRYYQEITTPLETPEASQPTGNWWRWLLIVPLIAGLWYAYYALTQHRPSTEKLSVYIDGPDSGSPGDTILFKNLSRFTGDSSTLSWRWSYFNLATRQEELFNTTDFHWPLVVPSLDSGSYLREIRLVLQDTTKGEQYETSLPFTVTCPELPLLREIEGNRQFEIGQRETFRALLDSTVIIAPTGPFPENSDDPAVNWLFEWDFGDGTQISGPSFVDHTYENNGQYRVQLTVTDTSATGFCTVTRDLEVKIGRDQAFLPIRELRMDQVSLLATWGWLFYVVLGTLGLALLYYWVRWLTRHQGRNSPQQQRTARDQAYHARFAHGDKAPYFLPLRDQSAAIQYNPVQTQLADALRLRQQGRRREIDINETLISTIEGGGFPAVRFRFASSPTEYLCLIDEQDRASHLGRLFKHLAAELQSQDVNLEIYYYRKHPNQFWNKYFPKGRTLDQLQRSYPNHRLLVFGDLHELIDPHATGQPNLRTGRARLLRQWPVRILLTPVPPVSWSYREKLLARLFNVFPCDSAGLLEVARHLENEEELLPDGPAFDRHRGRLREQRNDADTEHRKWRRWRNIKTYLETYDPQLVQWCAALSVFPLPSWEMTIAIGQALGFEVTYDKLLVLARIPMLQGDRFDERLRREMQEDLTVEYEHLARQAVQQELSAIRAISAGSHALRDLETTLAIQEFALNPLADEQRETVRFLLRDNLLKPSQEAELDRITKQATLPARSPITKAATRKVAPRVLSVRDWLEEDIDYELDAPRKKTPQDRSDLRRAVLFTLAYVILLVAGWHLGGTDTLYSMVFGTPRLEQATNTSPRHYFFVKETALIDSAVIYNNQGVEQARIGTLRDTLAAPYFRQAIAEANDLIHGKGDAFNGEDIPYALANANLGKLYYNAAAGELNNYLNDSVGPTILPEALRLLERAFISDSIALDVWHARGVIHYYTGNAQDSSEYYYNLLDSLDYFQTLDYSPNLATLLQREPSRIIDVEIVERRARALDINIRYFLDPSVERDAELYLATSGSGGQPAAQTEAAVNGENTLTLRLVPPRRQPGKLSAITVELRKKDGGRRIDFAEQPFVHDWKAAPTTTQTTTQEPIEPPVAKGNVKIEGVLLDAWTKEAIDKQELKLTIPPRDAKSRTVFVRARTNDYGNFVLESEISDLAFRTTTELVFEVNGYQAFPLSFNFDNPLPNSTFSFGSISLTPQVLVPKMQAISGGTFLMGNSEKSAPEDARPQHEVYLDNYQIGTFEVTFEEYDLFCEATGRPKPDDEGWGRGRRPVIGVSWEDAVAYCNWLSEQHGHTPYYDPDGKAADLPGTGSKPYRLPTEAEWEYAARGGIMGDKSQIYAGSDDLSQVGWYATNSNDQTYAVGQLRPNNAGTYDMSGNVWEWCGDWYGSYPSTRRNNPSGPDYGSYRIVRGGAWIQEAYDCRVFVRQYWRPSERQVYIGFRLAR